MEKGEGGWAPGLRSTGTGQIEALKAPQATYPIID